MKARNFAATWTDSVLTRVPQKQPRTSWWLTAPAEGFTHRADDERAAMDRGPLGKIAKPIMAMDSGR